MKLHTSTIGSGTQHLFLIHGWGLHSAVWQSFIPFLVNDFQITMVDLPGFGLSPTLTKEYSLRHVATELLEVAPRQSIWVGWSLGGLVASMAATLQPQRISQLIHLASSPCFTAKEDWPGMKEKALHGFADDLTHDYHHTLQRFIQLQVYRSTTAKQVAKSLQQQLGPTPDIKTLQASLLLLLNSDLRNVISTIQCPSLYIYGHLDAIVPRTQAQAMQSLAPEVATVMIKEAAHLPFLSHSEHCAELFKDFIHASIV